MKKIKKPSKKVVIILAAIVVAAVIGASSYWFLVRDEATDVPGNGTGEAPVNLEPATEEDRQRAEDNKQDIVDREKQLDNQNDTSKKSVQPTITYAGQYGSVVEAGAEVNAFESSGTCTATFTSGNSKITRSVQAIQNVNRMSCPVMSAPVSEFNPKGSWSVVVSYSSGTAAGSSTPVTFTVE